MFSVGKIAHYKTTQANRQRRSCEILGGLNNSNIRKLGLKQSPPNRIIGCKWLNSLTFVAKRAAPPQMSNFSIESTS